MNFWNQISVLRILVPFSLGILSSIYLSIDLPLIPHLLWQIPLLGIFIWLSESKIPKRHYQFKRWSGAFVFLFFYAAGIQLSHIHSEIYSENHYSQYLNNQNSFIAKIVQEPREKSKVISIVATISCIKQQHKWHHCKGKVLLQLAKSKLANQIQYGQLLLINSSLNLIASKKNPGEFDYQAYLSLRNIQFQCYLDSTSYKVLRRTEGNLFLQKCSLLRKELLFALQEGGITGENYAVGSALILGYEEKLDDDIRTAYSASGALHVLSVSGLHVAIVFVILNTLLKFFEKWKYGKLIKAILLIGLLWLYAGLTGFSPSVMRSAAMFTLVILGQALSRFTNIYNTLAASMLMLLVYNPFLLMEVGFQLSYLAVLGIVSIHPLIERIWEPKNYFVSQVWTIVSVSLAAQIATYPLAAYYFHQFPSYFLIANLIVIPISTLILYLGVATCFVIKIKLLTHLFCLLLNVLLQFLNDSVHYFEELPFAVINGISYTIVQLLLLYFIIGSLIVFLYFRHPRMIYITLLGMFFLMLNLCLERWNHYKQRKLIVYALKGNIGVAFLDGDSNHFFASSEFYQNQSKQLKAFRTYWWECGIKTSKLAEISSLKGGYEAKHLKFKNNLIQFYDKKILYLNEWNCNDFEGLKDSIPIDLLILSTSIRTDLKSLIENLKVKKIVFDSSSARSSLKTIKKELNVLRVPMHDTRVDGAYVEDM